MTISRLTTGKTMTTSSVKSPSSRSRIAWMLAGLCALAILAFNAEAIARLRHQFFPKRFGVVETGRVYRSGQISSRLIRQTLVDNHIAMVVDLTEDNPIDPEEGVDEAAEQKAIADLGIERRQHVLLADGTGDVVVYAAAVRSVVDAVAQGKPVLVHCAAGSQRTGGVIALYRLFVQQKDPAEVMREMQAFKYSASYSPKLLEYLNSNMPRLAEELAKNGAIERVPEELPVLRVE